MIGIVATLKVKEGMNEPFEALLKDLAQKSETLEPGCLQYKPMRHLKDPQTYILLEQYEDKAAMDAHMASDHFREAGPKMGEFLAEKPILDKCESI